ncbi:type II toxin-antitoxin system RelE/ParE family toxin [Halomonas shantousis]
MIDSFRDSWLYEFHVNGTIHRAIPSDLEAALLRKLDILDFANSEADLRVPPGNRFEHLKGSLKGWCSIRVNRQYRLIFEWDGQRAHNVYLDPHTYR